MRSTEHPTAATGDDTAEPTFPEEVRRFIDTVYDASQRLARVIERRPRSRDADLAELYAERAREIALNYERARSYPHDDELMITGSWVAAPARRADEVTAEPQAEAPPSQPQPLTEESPPLSDPHLPS